MLRRGFEELENVNGQANKFELISKRNDKVINSCKLNLDEMRLLLGGLFYAQARDSIPERRNKYRKLRKKIKSTSTLLQSKVIYMRGA